MTSEQERYLDALLAIPCAQLDYADWTKVGMACKDAGLTCEDWERWCATDTDRYKPGECARKWDGFTAEQADGITAGSLIYMAREHGWSGNGCAQTTRRRATATTGTTQTPAPVLDLESVTADPSTPAPLDPVEQLQAYARALFVEGDNINLVFNCDEAGKPCGWGITLTLADLLDNAGELLAHVNAAIGAFIRINPVVDDETLKAMQEERTARGERPRKAYADEHAAAWRYALIEADPENAAEMSDSELEADKARQLDAIHRLRLPCAAVLDSGRKSIHAVVKVDAADAEEYRARVRWLHAVCNANGIPADASDKNPTRMSRLPGAVRGDSMQRLIETNAGMPTWAEWSAWVKSAAPRDAKHVEHGIKRGGKNPKQIFFVDLMRTDPDVMGAFGTNELDGGIYVTGPLPWDMLGEQRRWQDADAENLFCWAEDRAEKAGRRDVEGAFTIVAAENRFNPIAQMLDALPEWDGEARADWLLWALFGCEATDYTRAVSHTVMRGAVLRAYRPGAKFDYCLTLIGPQGCGKSRGVARMAMRPEFLCESVSDLTDHKLTAEQTLGKWICELAELEGMTGRRLTGVKQALTMTHATVRLAYGRNPIDLPRSCIFVATTNEPLFLSDPTGARRFLPVRCAVADRGGWEHATENQLEAFVMQAWAEVVREYKAALALPSEQFAEAFPVWLSPDMERAADEAREAASIEDTDAGAINEWLATAVGMGTTRVCARQVAEKALEADMSRQTSRRITADVTRILNTCCPGWTYAGKQRVAGYGTVRAWDYTGGAAG